tara:strand:+ start:174 stop:437 length:264 start_codon:yes stop_codon:yes gene_type:complete
MHFLHVRHKLEQLMDTLPFHVVQIVCAAALLTCCALCALKRCIAARRTALRAHLGDAHALQRRRRGSTADDERYALLLPITRFDGAR